MAVLSSTGGPAENPSSTNRQYLREISVTGTHHPIVETAQFKPAKHIPTQPSEKISQPFGPNRQGIAANHLPPSGRTRPEPMWWNYSKQGKTFRLPAARQ